MSSTPGSRRIYRKPISLPRVIEVIEKYFKLEPKGIECVPLSEAVNRVLAEDVHAIYSYPPFDRALYDGYALIADDIAKAYEDNPVKLSLKGRISAGESPKIELKRGECCEVATGAPIPYPADVVLPIEYSKEVDNLVYIYRRFSKGFGIQYACTDCVKGEVVAKRGTLLTPLLIGTLASVGITKVKVYTKPTIGIIAIGNELIEPGKTLERWKVYESNSFMVKSFLKDLGLEAHYLGLIRDRYEDLKVILDKALIEFDVVMTIGGTSAGYEDIVYRVLESYEPGIIVHGLKVKPGSPTIIAIAGDKLIIGLPGFPLSCFLVLHLIVKEILCKITGLLQEKRELYGILLKNVEGTLGYVKLVPALIRREGGTFYAYPIHLHSGFLLKASLCDGFILIPEDRELITKGERAKIVLTNFKDSDLIFIGSHCPLTERILLELHRQGIRVKYLFTGSMSGVVAIKDGFADIAGIHIYSPKSDSYNRDLLEDLGIRDIVLIRGYDREQGFILRRGLGDVVNSFMDIINLRLRFINRNKGSGTRALVDYLILKEAEKRRIDSSQLKASIRGYNVEVSTHESIALAIVEGKADVGVGIRYVAEKYNLDFTRIKYENYDFLIRKSFMKSSIFRVFNRLLTEFLRSIIGEYRGYRIPDTLGEVIYEA
ncbi:MAG: molybdopterin biosynthesis protein [Thermoprotei archaeon]|nr:MAG: molybdopterin biosynthesis protein [Thermoprotei archaeon]